MPAVSARHEEAADAQNCHPPRHQEQDIATDTSVTTIPRDTGALNTNLETEPEISTPQSTDLQELARNLTRDEGIAGCMLSAEGSVDTDADGIPVKRGTIDYALRAPFKEAYEAAYAASGMRRQYLGYHRIAAC